MTDRPKPIAFEHCINQTNARNKDHSKNLTALIDNDYKIISKDGGKTYSLYHLINDPGERKNLAKKQPEILQKMISSLNTWRRSCTESRQEKNQ